MSSKFSEPKATPSFMSTDEQTHDATVALNNVHYRRIGGLWHGYDYIDRGWKPVSDAMEITVSEAYEAKQEQAKAAADVTVETAPESTEIKPSQNETVSTVEGPQVITVPLLFPVVSVPSKTCKVCGNEAANGIICDDCKPQDGDPKPVAKELTVKHVKVCEICGSPALYGVRCSGHLFTDHGMPVAPEQPQYIPIDEIANDVVTLLAQAMATVSEQAKRLEEQQAEINRLTCAAKQRETEVAKATDEQARAERKAQHAIDEAKRWKAESKVQKTANQGLIESLAATRAHIELLQRQTSVAGIIETRTEQPTPEAPKTLPFVQD